jgi:hypothetical protein
MAIILISQLQITASKFVSQIPHGAASPRSTGLAVEKRATSSGLRSFYACGAKKVQDRSHSSGNDAEVLQTPLSND